MQIQATSSAALAASIVAQSTAKDKGGESQVAAASANALQADSVEQSGSANPDRDAQGQEDGRPGHAKRITDEIDFRPEETSDIIVDDLTFTPDEPPSQLDIIG